MVAWDEDDRCARVTEAGQRLEDDEVGFGGDRAVLVDVTGDQDGVDGGVPRHLHDLVQGGERLFVAGAPSKVLPHVPISRVQDSHGPSLPARVTRITSM